MNETALLADHLESLEEALIAMWRQVALREGDVPSAEGLSDHEFRDHIPQLLDRLGERLRSRVAGVESEGRKHGLARFLQGYDVAEATLELGHLRTTLTRATFAFAGQRSMGLQPLEAALATINDVIDETIAESVARIHEEVRRKDQDAQREADRHRIELESERALAEVERLRLRVVMDSLPLGLWIVDADGTVVHVNGEGERLQGFSRDLVIGRANLHAEGPALYALQHLDGTPYAGEDFPISRALRGEVTDQEEILWEVGGSQRVITVSAAPIREPSGRVIGGLAAVQDITARKFIEQELRRQHEFINAVTRSMGEGLYAIDEDGKLMLMNPAAERMLGWTEAELIASGLDLHAAIHHTRPDGTPYPVEECPLWGGFQRRERLSCDETFVRRDGTHFSVSLTATPLTVNRHFSGAVVTFKDITERKRLESRLADSEARFRTIAEQSPMLIWQSGLDGLCNFFNQTWLDFRGRSLDQELGDGWIEGVHPEECAACMETYRDAFARREPFRMTYRLRRHDGAYRWIDDHGTPLFDGRGVFLGFLGSCIDVTERVELENALRRQSELAEEASQHKTRLMSALSHDARTPLNAVALSAELLQMHLGGGDDAEVEDCLRMIRQSVKNVHDLLRDLLDLSRIDAGVVTVEPSTFPVDVVLEECLAGITPQARLKRVEVRTEPGPLAGVSLRTDRSKLKQVLSNLLSNALRFTDSGHIRLFTEHEDGQVRIAVEDTGIGIDPADHERIFDEFATLDNPHRGAGEGTGLGLAIGRRLANLLGGQILIQSRPGEGSTFRVALPDTVIADEAEPIAPVTREPTMAPERAAGPCRVLIAEDDLTNRLALVRLLQRLGFEAIAASNGREAIAMARTGRPAVILMDVMMPVMDGIDATRALRADPLTRETPIFALTGDVTLSSRQRIASAGVNGFLEKPIEPDQLARTLAAFATRTSGAN